MTCSTSCAATSASNRWYLTEESYEDIKRASQQWLKAPWTLTDEQGVYAATATRARARRATPGVGGDLYVSGLGLYGRWLRRPDRFPLHEHPIKVKDADVIIDGLLIVMAEAGMLAKIEEREQARSGTASSRNDRVAARRQVNTARPIPCGATRPKAGSTLTSGEFYAETANGLAGLGGA